jgi:hypothetical protein
MFAAGMAFALCVALAVRSSAADVAEWIPSDALVVFKINKLQQVNQEAAALMREFGIAEQHPEMADPLAAFQAETGIREGLNLEGNLAVYLANGDLEGEVPPMVILIPVSDYEAFLGNFKNRQDEGGGITRVRMGDQEEMEEGDMGADDDAGYVMQMGEYAGLSPMKDLLKKPEQVIEFSGVTAGMLEDRDMVLYANMKQAGPMLFQAMQEQNAREQAREEMKQGLAENAEFAKFEPVADAFVDQMFTLIERFLQESDAAAMSMDLGDQGIGLGGVAQFKEGSYLAEMFGGMQASDDALLDGLPEGNYIFFAGSTDNRETSTRFFDDFAGPIIEKLRAVEGAEKLADYVDAIRTQVTSAGEMRTGMFAPSGPLGGSALLQTVSIQGGDVAKLKQTQRQIAELQPEIMAQFMGQMEEEGMDMGMGSMQMKYEEGVKEVAGVNFDKLSTDMDPEQQQNSPAAMPMRMLFGPEGPTTYLGQVEDKLLMVSGLSDQQIAAVIESVQGDSAPLADDAGVRMVLDQLPENRSAVFFFRPDELVRSGVGLSRQMGMNLPIQMPEDLPPIGFAAAPAENSLRTEGFLPKDLISALIVAALQAQQQFGGMQEDDL